MRFCFIFWAFFMNYRAFWGGCLHFLGGFLVYSLANNNKCI